jgi:hypothetical protein
MDPNEAQDRFHLRQEELKRIEEAKAAHPELFIERSIVEDAELLSKFGIVIPGKEALPKGYLKLWPEDFIVEERIDGGVREITSTQAPLPESPDPTLYATLVKCGVFHL